MTVEELKVQFTANIQDFKKKTDEMKEKLSATEKVSESLKKTIEKGMKSSSEKTQRMAEALSSLGDKYEEQKQKIDDATRNVSFYADEIEKLKQTFSLQNGEVDKQRTKVKELETTYGKIKEISERFGLKNPLAEQLEEADRKANILEDEITTLKKALAIVPEGSPVNLENTILSVEDARSKLSLLIKEHEEACDAALRLNDAMESLGKGDSKYASTQGMKSLKEEISSAKKKLSELKNEAEKTNSKISSTASKVASEYKKLENAQTVFTKLQNKIEQASSKLHKSSSIISRVKNAVKSIGTAADGSLGKLSKIPSSFKKIASAAVALTLIKSIFGRLRSIVSNYIGQNDALNARVESMKNAFGRLLAPAIEIVVTAFEKLMPYLMAVGEAILNVLSSFSVFAGLKNTSKAIDGVTSSTNALSKAQRELYGFDKITKQSDDSSSSSNSGSTSPSTDYGTAEIGSIDEIITSFNQKLNEGIASINWANVGQSLSNGINTALGAIRTAITTFDWKNLGSSIGTAFSNIDFSSIVGNLSGGLSDTMKSLQDLAIGFVQGTDWSKVGTELWDNFVALLTNFDFAGIISKGVELVGSAIGGAAQLIGGLASSIWKSIKSGWETIKTTYFAPFADETGKYTIEGIWSGIKKAISAVGTWIKDNIFTPFIKGFKKAFGIASPAKEMEPMGGYVIDGFKNGIGDVWAKVKQKFTDFLTGIKGWFTEKKEELSTAWNNFTSGIKGKTAEMKATVATKWNDIKANWTNITSNINDKAAKMKAAVATKWNDIKANWTNITSNINDKAAEMKAAVATKWGDLKDKWANITDKIKDKTAEMKAKTKNVNADILETVKNTWAKIKSKEPKLTAKAKNENSSILDTLENRWSEIATKTSTLTAKAVESGKTKLADIKSYWSNISSKTAELTMSVKDSVSTTIKNIVKGIVETLNKFIRAINKLPGVDVAEIPVPKFARGGVVDSPTLGVFGEDGKEAVMPLENNTGWISELANKIAVIMGGTTTQTDGAKTVVIPVYIGSKHITDVVVEDINRTTESTGKCPIKV